MKWRTLGVILVCAVAARAEDSLTNDQLLEEIAALKQRVGQQDIEMAEMRSRLDEDWMTQRRAEEIKLLVREVLADAETRAALLDNAVTAGHNGTHFFIASDDGNFLLQLLGQIQLRYVYGASDDARDQSTTPVTDLDDNVEGFELSRIRLGFKGHVVDPTWRYFMWLGFDRGGGALLLDAYIQKALDDEWTLTVGQFKLPLWQEWLVSETRQQLVERSLIQCYFSGTYTQGLLVDWRGDDLHVAMSINDGAGMMNKGWDAEGVEAFALTGRVEWMALGNNWKSYADFESQRDQTLLVLGGGVHWQQGNYGTSGVTLSTGDETQVLRWTIDGSLEIGPANLFAALLGNHVSESSMLPDMDQYGLLVQGGYFICDDLELIGRYEWGDLDVAGVEELSIVTVGFSKLFHGHQLKWTTDVGYAFNALNRVSIAGNSFGWSDASKGWRSDAAGSDGQIVLRTQMQLLF